MFFKAKNSFLWILISIKPKLAWPVYKKYEIKTKMVQEQWLQLKMKILVGYNMKIDI